MSMYRKYHCVQLQDLLFVIWISSRLVMHALQRASFDQRVVVASSMLQGVVDCCVAIHQSVERKSKKYYDELRR